MAFKLNQDRHHHIPKQKRKVTHSAAHDAALRERGSLTVWFTDEAIAAWRAEPRGADRFHHPPARAHSGRPGPLHAEPSGGNAGRAAAAPWRRASAPDGRQHGPSSLSYALTIERVPDQFSATLVTLGHPYGAISFVLVSVLVMLVFGMVLKGAPALILFGPLLTPIAAKLGIDPLQFGIVMVVAMGMGFFAPPIGVGLFATVAMTGTRMSRVVGPMMKYLAVLAVALLAPILVPQFSLWLPRHLGM